MSNLSALQFSYRKDLGGHEVTASIKDKPVGMINWAGGGKGQIEKIFVAPEHRRKGIATALLGESRRIAKEKDILPPAHSERRSEAGDAWAKSLKEPLPKRKSDRELFR